MAMPGGLTGPSRAASRAAHRNRARSQHIAQLGRYVALRGQPGENAAAGNDVENQLRQRRDRPGGARSLNKPTAVAEVERPYIAVAENGRRVRHRHRGQPGVDRVAEEQRVELLCHQPGYAELREQRGDRARRPDTEVLARHHDIAYGHFVGPPRPYFVEDVLGGFGRIHLHRETEIHRVSVQLVAEHPHNTGELHAVTLLWSVMYPAIADAGKVAGDAK